MAWTAPISSAWPAIDGQHPSRSSPPLRGLFSLFHSFYHFLQFIQALLLFVSAYN